MSHTAVQYGIGPIGARIVELAHSRGIEFVGAIDIDPEKVGEDLGSVAGLGESLDVTVTDDAETALESSPDVVFHSTLSDLDSVSPQIEESVSAGADVVSTTEELAYPWLRNPEAAERIDDVSREHGRTVLGTGINPGFAMDVLPAVVTTPCQRVESVTVTRVQDAGQRRKPLQEKVGAGMSVDRWNAEIAEGAGHVGTPESVGMIADALGWELDEIEETIEPVVADERVESEYFAVEPGDAAGVHQIGVGYVNGESAITVDLSMYIGAENPRDVTEVRGTPDVSITAAGGFHGDVSTPAVVVNSVPRVRDGSPGLATMIDLATPRYTELS